MAACAPPQPQQPPSRPDIVGEARPGEVRRAWRALNEQARAIAGALVLTPDGADALTLAFAEGITLRAEPLTPGQARRDLGPAFAEIAPQLGAAWSLEPWVYRVRSETVATSAPRGGLCGGLRTTFLAIAEFVDADDRWILRIAAFHRPPEEGAGAHVCFAFDYGLPGERR